MPRAQQHPHKLKRMRYKSTGSTVFFCVLPDCNFKSEIPFCLGKKAICWRCNREFIMNEYSLRLAKPHCNSCTKSKEETKEVTAESVTIGIAAESTMSLRDRLDKISMKSEEEDI